MSDLLKKFGNNVQKFRRFEGISQEELAFRADIHRTFLSEVERGKRNINIYNLCKIAKALNKEIGEFFPPINTICV